MSKRFSNSSGFSLVEMMVVVAIVVILAVLTYAPYSYYSDLAKVRISAEKIEQAFSEAKLSTSMGLSVPWTDSNGDAYVTLSVGATSVPLSAAKSGSGFAPESEFKILRDIPLEKGVTVSGLPASKITVKFSAPTGSVSAVDWGGNAVAFTGGTVGLAWAATGTLSKIFRSVSAY